MRLDSNPAPQRAGSSGGACSKDTIPPPPAPTRVQVGVRRKIITLNNHGDEDIIQDGIYRIYHGWNGLPGHQNWN